MPIQVDATDDDRQVSLLSFFPANTTARPGDTLRFEVESIGEPHTVALGTLVDAGLRAFDEVPSGTIKQAFLGEPEEMYKLPSIFGPAPTYQPENQAAGQPCYLESGEPPVADACPQVDQPAFDGTQTFYNSGMLTDTNRYEVASRSASSPAFTGSCA